MSVSFDCFLKETRIWFFSYSDFIYKTFLSICFCIFLVIFYFIVGLIIKIILWKWILLRWILFVFLVTIVFIQYTSFTNSLLNLFNCWKIENENLLLRDMLTVCWKSGHLYWTLSMGLPGLLLVLIIIPLSGILFLVLQRRKAEETHFMMYFILLY